MSLVSKCAVCKNRKIVYKRSYSGDLMCDLCLEKTLIKAVKKVIGKYRILKPFSKVLVPITYTAPHYSAALAHILAKLERKFSTEVIIARPSDIEYDVGVNWPPLNARELIVDIKVSGLDITNPSACVRFDRRWSLFLAKRLGIDIIALPFSRTDLIIFALNALLVEGIEAISEALDYISINNVKFFSAFSEVEGEIVSAYVAIRSLWFYSNLCKYKIDARDVFYSIAGRRPELEFSIEKTLNPIFTKSSTLYNRCNLCGGFSKGNTCRYCNKSDLQITLLS